MLSSLNPLTSLNCLEALPVNSLNSISTRVRLALLQVFLPHLCEGCRPSFSETFQKTQSTPLLLRALCPACKISYVRDKRAFYRKKASSDSASRPDPSASTKLGAKKKNNNLRSLATSHHANGNSGTSVDVKLPPLTFRIKKIDLLSCSNSNSSNGVLCPESTTEKYRMLLTPPPDEMTLGKQQEIEINLASHQHLDSSAEIEIETEIPDQPQLSPTNPSSVATLSRMRQIYEQFSEAKVNWCRYCGVAGETGTLWKLGPWGEASLCHKHGCEFFGCGFARATTTRLDLTAFYRENRADRKHPIVSEYCAVCWESLSPCESKSESVQSVQSCHGCPLSYHSSCWQTRRNEESLLDIDGSHYCSRNCFDNFQTCLIKPQFPSKSRFPFYRTIARVEQANDDSEISLEPSVAPSIKLKLNLASLQSAVKVQKKRRKYRKHEQMLNSVDRFVAFVPIKVDQSIHSHAIINTPQWNEKSLAERQAYLPELHFEEEILDDSLLLARHARYEQVEKTTRLLKPGILQDLISESQ